MSRITGHELRKTQQAIKHRIERDRQDLKLSLTLSQARVLSFVHAQTEPVYQKDIEEHLRIRRSTATQMLNVLQRDGYIVRERAEHDARLKEIQTTKQSEEAVSELKVYLNDLEENINRGISEEELEIFLKVLDRIKQNMEK